ncbi:MAG: phosphoglycerate mutase, partial [Clostridia bacterium]|nr:phosphoglycerate mutase [Clostridia bacterium]
RCSNMQVIDVPGATGYIDTNFDGKAKAAITALKDGQDYVYIHVEAPDECGHRGEVDNKVKSLEIIDRKILAPILQQMKEIDEFTLLIMPDHPTPLSIMTHCSDPVPYLLYRSNAIVSGPNAFNEKSAEASGVVIEKAHTLIDRMIQC